MLDAFLEKTLLGYTQLGYVLRHRRGWDDLPTLQGRTVLVTGAAGGLGAATAQRLHALGATLILVGRRPQPLQQLAQRWQQQPGSAPVHIEVADLSSMREVQALAQRVLARGEVDLLINNVGVLLNQRQQTAEGLETTFATNLLGHYLLTECLWPLLEQRREARVINVSSGGMYTQRIRPDDLQTQTLPYNGPDVYARTKRAQVILTQRWAARHPQVAVYSLHPGWADTTGVQNALPVFRRLTAPLLRDAASGADTSVWLAACAPPLPASGAFYHDRRAWPVHRWQRTRETAAERDALEQGLQDCLQAVLGPNWRLPQ